MSIEFEVISMNVLKYFIGALIVFGIVVFTIKQIKSVIDSIRDRRKPKSSTEGDPAKDASSTEEVGKEVTK